MSVSAPHFHLFSRANGWNHRGEWSIVLKAADGSATLKAHDQEPGTHGERLELLAVVRGLEALDQPSRVTIVTPSKYVSQGIAYGLEEWRRNNWTWESFGEMVPVKNRDLWQRLDRALKYHDAKVRLVRIDQPHVAQRSPATEPPKHSTRVSPANEQPEASPPRAAKVVRQLPARFHRSRGVRVGGWKQALRRLGTSWMPKPWLA